MSEDPFGRNEVIFIGRLGKDPSRSYTATKKALSKFSLAVSQGKKRGPMWLNITCWQEVAEQVYGEAEKGDLVQVKGRLAQSEYEGRSYYEVIADSVEIIQSKKRALASDLVDDPDVPF